MSSSAPEPPQELHFPPIRIDKSFAGLDIDTLMMRSNQSRRSEEARSFLEESSYEVLGESMCEASDDEGNTESLASTTPDDVSSISDGDEFDVHDEDEDDGYANNEPSRHPSEPNHDTFASTVSSPNASMMTSMAETQTGEPSFIQMEETSTEDGSTRAHGIVSRFSEARELPHVLRAYGYPALRLTLRMALSERYLPVPRSYRILYVGEFPEWGVKEINARIGAALDATPSSSRFNIVQGPAYPGSTSSSNIQLERSGLELVVDHCTTPKILQETDRPARVLITLDDGTELTFGSGKHAGFEQEPSSDCLPDLVIFCHYTVSSESDTAVEVEKARLARQGFRRLCIPCLDIATTRPYGKCPESFAFDLNTLRLCMEGRTTSSQDYETQETLPIDIYTFSSIDPAELNRHLSFISPHSNRSDSRHEKKTTKQWSFSRFVPSVGLMSHSHDQGAVYVQPRLWVALVVLSAILSVYLAGFSSFASFTHTLPNDATVAPVVSLPSTASASSATQSTLLPRSVTPLAPLSLGPTSRDLTVPSGDISPKPSRKRAISSKEEPPEGLTIEVKGPHHFLIRPTKPFTSGKRKPQLEVQVLQNSKTIPVQVLAPTDDDSYTVILQDQHSPGTFTVDVVLRRKPLLHQSFQIELGVPKSRIVDLIVGAQVAQLSLKNLSNHFSKSVQASVVAFEGSASSALEQTLLWKERIQHTSQSVADHLEDAKQTASRRWSQGSRASKEASSILWQNCREMSARAQTNIWEFSASIGRSRPVKRARSNVRTIRKRFDKHNAVGTGGKAEKSGMFSTLGKRKNGRGRK